ncbi:hypothetical protein GCM10022393_28660 [Aquimarina addita]|uniref:DUF3857 domain-containing protein n=1 Tax=Aquimarina addita TaxID=870485 RepID=A0ABP6UQ48_9FLAO
MGNLNQIIIGVILVVSTGIYGQNYKFGKVSKEELLETAYSLDSSASAAVLYEDRKVEFVFNQTENSFDLVTEVFKRVKFYKKEGFKHATNRISLYKKKSKEEEFKGLKGVTYTLVNGNVIETKLKKEGIFKNEIHENRDEVRFTMPSLKEGCVVEYKYKIISPYVFNIDRLYLQYEIPIKKLEVSFESPEYFNFKKFTTGYLPISLKESSKNGKITFVSKSRTTNNNVSQTNYNSNDLDYKINTYSISSSDVPAFKEEPFSGNPSNYLSSIVFELSYTAYPNSPVKSYATTWENVAKTIYERSSFGKELKKITYYKEDIDQLLAGISNEFVKTQKVFEFVKKKMTWNKRNSVYTRDGVKKAYQNGTGNAAEINLMLTSMLSYARVDANPVLVNTADRLFHLFPTLDGFNYVIARVKLPDGSIQYLDATDKYGEPNVLPDRVIRGTARVIAKNGTSQDIQLRPQKPSVNNYRILCEIDEQGFVKGKFNVIHLDYLAHDFRVAYGNKKDVDNASRIQKEYEINELETYTIKGMQEYGKGVSERFDFVTEDQVELIEDEMFFSPLLFLKDKENVFKSDERKYPVDFGYGFSNKYMINIKIPEGYEVVESPVAGVFKLPDNMGAFTYQSNYVNGMIQLVVDETINASLIPAEQYPVIKEFYNMLIEKEGEQVVLKKI